jgi:hypothetical protein
VVGSDANPHQSGSWLLRAQRGSSKCRPHTSLHSGREERCTALKARRTSRDTSESKHMCFKLRFNAINFVKIYAVGIVHDKNEKVDVALIFLYSKNLCNIMAIL